MGVRPVRGKLLEIDVPSAVERAWIGRALEDPGVHVPLGMARAPTEAELAAEVLTLQRGAEVRSEPARFLILRALQDGRSVGFFVHFGWDHPNDSTREIDLAFPDPNERGVGTYLDATILVSQLLLGQGLAKRLRWRVVARRGHEPLRSSRHGGRLVQRQEERHPVTGEWLVTYIYEYALTDMRALGERAGVDPARDYAEVEPSVFRVYGDARDKPDGDG